MERPTSTPSHDPSFASASGHDDDLPRFTGWLRPAVDAVAALRWPVRRKLLAGFLCGALLLVAMGILSLVVMEQMNNERQQYERAAKKQDFARQMLYDVTAQSHYRAMALMLKSGLGKRESDTNGGLKDPAHYVDELTNAKSDFLDQLKGLEDLDPKDQAAIKDLREVNATYALTSARVSKLYEDRHYRRALRAHINWEHPASHKVEDELNKVIIPAANDDMESAADDYRSSHRLQTVTVVAFSALSVLTAMILGFIFSWAFILPVRKVQGALAQLSGGRFPEPVVVPNRDEFGYLTRDLNATSDQLQTLFSNQHDLAAELRQTNASLARASEAKTNFLASVSHELRTPMNAVLGFTEALLAGVDGPLNQDQKTSLGWVQRGGNHLLSLINELLDLSRIEAGRLRFTPEPFHPVDMVRSAIAEHRPLAEPKGIGLSYRDLGAPTEVVQDPQRVRQVLDNLLGNAVKLTEEGEVEVTVSEADNGLQIAVRDSGPGIPDSECEAIFEEFHQAHGSEQGTGLGLSISRRLARAMGGDVSVQSEVGRGSTFVLWIPSEFVPPQDGVSTDHRRPSSDEPPLEDREVP